MRLLFVHAHPVPESFNTALHAAAVESARAKGHEVRLIDLYAEGFNPVMSAEERRGYTEDVPIPADLPVFYLSMSSPTMRKMPETSTASR